MIEIILYREERKVEWDKFIANSRNGTFLHYRDFMEYHKDRFNDLSLMFYKGKRLISVLPGNVSNSTFYSHQGLTYGGLIQSMEVGSQDIIKIFVELQKFLGDRGLNSMVYKCIPYIYNVVAAQEDLYALFVLKANRIVSNLSSVVFQNNRILFSESRKSGIRKAIKNGLEVEEVNDFSIFWNILTENMINRYGKSPVHSLYEIQHLKEKFPLNIRLFVSFYDGIIVGGVTLFITRKTVHVQYIAANNLGKSLGAIDFLFEFLINKFSDLPYFDFGHSNEQDGNILNENLIFQKEGFGARGVVYEVYELNLNQNRNWA